MHVRVGIAAILEGMEGTADIKKLVPALIEVAKNSDIKVRADACHYLGLTADAAARAWLEARIGDEEAIPALKNYINDDNEMVREIASEGLLELQQTLEAP